MLQALITGFTMGLYLAVSVGPILFTVIKQSLENGIRGGFSFVAGIWLSDFLFVVLSNTFTVFTTHFANMYIRQIGYGGGLLLLALGCYYTFFKPAKLPQAIGINNPIGHGHMARLFITGFSAARPWAVAVVRRYDIAASGFGAGSDHSDGWAPCG